MTDNEWRKQYDDHLSRLRQAYRTAAAGNRVQLTKNTTVTGSQADLRELRNGKFVLVGRVDESGLFHPESYTDNADDFASAMYWRGVDVQTAD